MKRPAQIAFLFVIMLSLSVKADISTTITTHNSIQAHSLIKNYCYDCHGRKKTKGKINLTQYNSLTALQKNPQLIEKMIEGRIAKFVNEASLTLVTSLHS